MSNTGGGVSNTGGRMGGGASNTGGGVSNTNRQYGTSTSHQQHVVSTNKTCQQAQIFIVKLFPLKNTSSSSFLKLYL